MIDYNTNFKDCGKDTKKLYGVINKLVGKTKKNPMPEMESSVILANHFANHFMDKIKTIRDDLSSCPLFDPPVLDCKVFSTFVPVDECAVKKLMLQTKATNCKTDPFPSSMLKKHIDVLMPLFERIINSSLTSGNFPQVWKTSIIRPLLKKPGLSTDFANYRPVNNLPFLSKVVEKCMLAQLKLHLRDEHLLPDYISAYRESHSCETTLLKLSNDILINMDQRNISPLMALDLSAAFDTVDHEVLIDVLQKRFGITDVALEWFKSYLSNRKITVQIDNCFSDELDLPFSVPQGSCAGPVLFNMYASTLLDYIRRNTTGEQVTMLAYADDHSCFNSFKAGDITDEKNCIKSLEDCADVTCEWMKENRLKMNNKKTEFIKFGNKVQLKKCVTSGIFINNQHIEESTCIYYVGVWMDNNLSYNKHIGEKCRKAMYALHRIRSIRSHLGKECLLQIIQSLVISQLDYCSSLLYGVPNTSLTKLQRVQNFAAKLILNKTKYDSSTACLKELHWLPIKYRILFRLLCVCFKCVHGQAPSELVGYFKVRQSSRYNLRASSGSVSFVVPKTNSVTFGDRAFSVAGPLEWNRLPNNIRISDSFEGFKNKLKTHLFSVAFPL